MKITINATNKTYNSIKEAYDAFINGELQLTIKSDCVYNNFYQYVNKHPELFTVEENAACSMKKISPITGERENILTNPDNTVSKTVETWEYNKPEEFKSYCKLYNNKSSNEVPIVVNYKGISMLFKNMSNYLTWVAFNINTIVSSYDTQINKSAIFGTPIKSHRTKKVCFTNTNFEYAVDKDKTFFDKLYDETVKNGYDKYEDYLYNVVLPKFVKKYLKCENIKPSKISYEAAVEDFMKNNNIRYMKEHGIVPENVTTIVYSSEGNRFHYFVELKKAKEAVVPIHTAPSLSVDSDLSTINGVIKSYTDMSSATLGIMAKLFESMANDKAKVEAEGK